METIDLETFFLRVSGRKVERHGWGDSASMKFGSLPKLHVSGTCRGIILRRISRESRFSTCRWLDLLGGLGMRWVQSDQKNLEIDWCWKFILI